MPQTSSPCALLLVLPLAAGCSQCSPDAASSRAPGTPLSEGAGCGTGLPTSFPYRPGCCPYTVDVPAGLDAGFSSSELGPRPTPEHVHLGWSGPTDTTMAVDWRTDAGTKVTEVLYATDSAAVAAAQGPSDTVQRALGHHVLLEGSVLDRIEPARAHETHLCGLLGSTTYYYKAGGPGAWSPVAHFITGPAVAANARFDVAVLGDSRSDPEIWARTEQAVAARGVAFQLHTGDAVRKGSNLEHWREFFEARTGSFSVGELLVSTPTMLVNGNHEGLAAQFVAQFAMPQEISPGELGAGKEWYSFDYGNAHIVGLNDWPQSSGLGQAQRDWLQADLGRVDRGKTPWIFVMHHAPLYSCGKHGSNLPLRKQWQPIFDQARVDLVFAGHDHMYERSKPIRGLDGSDGTLAEAGPNGAPVGESGTVYVTAAGAGAPLYGFRATCPHTQVGESVNHYVLLQVDGRTLRLTAYRLDGSTLDQVELRK